MSTAVTASLLTLSLLCVNVEALDVPKIIWDFLATFCGIYTNVKKVNEGFTHHDFVMNIARSFFLPNIWPYPLMYLEVAENKNRVEFRQLVLPSPGPDNVLILKLCNFTGNNISGPGNFDFSLLDNLTKEDCHFVPGCEAGVVQVAPGVFVGEWPVCSHKANGTFPAWGVTLTCTHGTVTIPVSGDEVRNFIPYDMIFNGTRFPLPSTPPDYKNPCDPKNMCPSAKS